MKGAVFAVLISLVVGGILAILIARALANITALIKKGTSQNIAKSSGYVMGINDVFFISFVVILILLYKLDLL